MNERIKELAKKSDPEYTGEEDDDMSHAIVGNVAIERFAELIVRECIQVGRPEDSYSDEWFKAKADSVSKIKQHFGFE